MAKLCPKGKAAAKRKFAVYPSAYANMYASGVCSGKLNQVVKRIKLLVEEFLLVAEELQKEAEAAR